MPAKRRCQFKTLVILPASSSSTSTTTPVSAEGAAPAQAAEGTSSSSVVQCPSAAVRIVGDCPHCSQHFCSTHRLPEAHRCSKLDACRDAAFEANKARLVSERTVASKIAST